LDFSYLQPSSKKTHHLIRNELNYLDIRAMGIPIQALSWQKSASLPVPVYEYPKGRSKERIVDIIRRRPFGSSHQVLLALFSSQP
jgi:hypothetical protein